MSAPTDRERLTAANGCDNCGKPLATQADFDAHPDGCQCDRCRSLCWRAWNTGGVCHDDPAPWRSLYFAARAREGAASAPLLTRLRAAVNEDVPAGRGVRLHALLDELQSASAPPAPPPASAAGLIATVTATIDDKDGDHLALGFEGCDTAVWIERREPRPYDDPDPLQVGQRVRIVVTPLGGGEGE